jgi:hypothetical protein
MEICMASTLSVTGSSVVSTNKVAALVEAAYRLQIAETALSINPNNIQIIANDDTKRFAISGVLPVALSFDSDGNVLTTATNYTSTSITPGGDIKSTNVSALVLEMLQMIIDAEDAKFLADPTFTAVTNLTIDSNAQTANFSTSIPFTTSLVSGKPTMTPTDYL